LYKCLSLRYCVVISHSISTPLLHGRWTPCKVVFANSITLDNFLYIKVGKYLIRILWNKCCIPTWLSGSNFLWQNIKHYYFYIISSFEETNSKHFNHKITFLFFFHTNNIKISNFLVINCNIYFVFKVSVIWHKYISWDQIYSRIILIFKQRIKSMYNIVVLHIIIIKNT